MNKLQHYSNHNNLENFVNFFSKLMKTPYSERSIEQLRHVLASVLPFFVFDRIYTVHHTKLIELLDQNIRDGKLHFGRIRGGFVDMRHFLQTLANTPNLKAVDALHPVLEALNSTHSFELFYDQMAQLEHRRISQSIEDGGTPTVKRKI